MTDGLRDEDRALIEALAQFTRDAFVTLSALDQRTRRRRT